MPLKTSEKNAALIYNFPFLGRVMKEFIVHELSDPDLTIKKATEILLNEKSTLIRQKTTSRDYQEVGDLYFAIFNNSKAKVVDVKNRYDIMRLIISCSTCNVKTRCIGDQISIINRIPQYILNVNFEVVMHDGNKDIVKEAITIFTVSQRLFN